MNNTERRRAAEWFRNTDFSTGARRCHSPPHIAALLLASVRSCLPSWCHQALSRPFSSGCGVINSRYRANEALASDEQGPVSFGRPAEVTDRARCCLETPRDPSFSPRLC